MSIPGSANPLLLRTAAVGGYSISRSLRFNSSDSAYLSKNFASAGNRKTWTWAGWYKVSAKPSSQFRRLFSAGDTYLIHAGSGGTATPDTLYWNLRGGGTNYFGSFANLFRDPSAWMHIVWSVDTTQATAANRSKLYINGTQLTAPGSLGLNYCPQDDLLAVNNTVVHQISSTSGYLDGYLADVFLIDGQALDPTSFGEFDSNGIWQPIEYAGTYGTNGFHLPFSDNSTAAALGTDTSGNGNDWTVNNFQVASIDPTAGVQSGITSAPINGSPYGNPTQWFDGNLATGAGVDGGSSNTTPRKWTFNTPISYSSSVRIRISTNEPNMGYHFNNVNTGLPNNGSTPTYYTVATGSGTISNLGVYNSNGSSQGTIHISAIEVDGALLVATPPQGNDSLVDSPTNGTQSDTGVGGEVVGNYCTWNPLNNGGITLSNGNLDWAGNGGGTKVSYGTIAISSGKWYFEASINGATSGVNWECGIARIGTANNSRPGASANGWQVGTSSTSTIFKVNNNSYTNIYTSGLSNGDILGVAFDVDNGRIWFARNGTWLEGSPSAGTGASFTNVSGTVAPFGGSDGSGPNSATNFGQRPFAYTAPSGFKALCTANLEPPTIADGSQYFQVIKYTGNGTTQTLPNVNSEPSSGLNFSPDFLWFKSRSNSGQHRLYDTIRGATNAVYSNLTNAEESDPNTLTAFNSTGFSLGSSDGVNGSSWTYAAWCWDAGSSTVSNTQGSITSTVRANPSAGFSIVKFTPGGAGQITIGHGLGAAPAFIIVKPTSISSNWYQWITGFTVSEYLTFTTAAKATSTNFWGTSLPSSTVFGYNAGGAFDHIAYCFAPVAGYNTISSWTGNGSSDGPFVYTGHRTRFLLYKRSDVANNWYIMDTARDPYNVTTRRLVPDSSASEYTYTTTDLIDVTANGFKIRSSNAAINANGGTYIFMALAESPFQYARAR